MAKKRTTARKVQAEETRPLQLPKMDWKAGLDDDGWDGDGLTPRQRAFVMALLGPAGGNASKAAQMAGYVAENRNVLAVTASRVLSYANVQRLIEREIGRRFGSPDDVRASISAIANGNAADYLDKDEKGRLVVSLEKLEAAGMLGLIHEIKEEGFQAGETVTIIKRKLKLYDKLKALELLGKLNGQFVERKDLTSGGLPVKFVAGIDEAEL